MPIDPDYGQTLVPGEELQHLQPAICAVLAEPITKAALFDIEQEIEREVKQARSVAAVNGDLPLEELLSDHFVRELHRDLYVDVWTWAGQYRRHETNIGVLPHEIAAEVRGRLGDIYYRWDKTNDWTARQLGIAVHAELLRIHPFTDGNGRSARLISDLVLLATTSDGLPHAYDWALDKGPYVKLLREFDHERDPRPLAEFVSIRPLDGWPDQTSAPGGDAE